MRTLITGANRGIGAAIYRAMKDRGGTVWGTHRAPSAGDFLQLDISVPQTMEGLRTAFGESPLDLLVCNAGVYLDKGQSLEGGYAASLWAETFAVNVTGVFQTVQAVLPNLQAAKGKIAIIGSQMGSHERASGGSYIYRASKAAVLNLGRNLATDLRSDGIAVGVYHPGWVRTDMGGGAADISVGEAAQGLMARFDRLTLATTGCFETWDGRAHPF